MEQLKENSKIQITLKATQTYLKIWQNRATEQKVNQKIEEDDHEELDKMLQVFYAEIRLLRKIHRLVLVHFLIYGRSSLHADGFQFQ